MGLLHHFLLQILRVIRVSFSEIKILKEKWSLLSIVAHLFYGKSLISSKSQAAVILEFVSFVTVAGLKLTDYHVPVITSTQRCAAYSIGSNDVIEKAVIQKDGKFD